MSCKRIIWLCANLAKKCVCFLCRTHKRANENKCSTFSPYSLACVRSNADKFLMNSCKWLVLASRKKKCIYRKLYLAEIISVDSINKYRIECVRKMCVYCCEAAMSNLCFVFRKILLCISTGEIYLKWLWAFWHFTINYFLNQIFSFHFPSKCNRQKCGWISAHQLVILFVDAE